MKLTTARLKKLIREELERVNEGKYPSDTSFRDVLFIIHAAAMKMGITDWKATPIAQDAAKELAKNLYTTSGSSLNVSKYRKGQPSSEEEEIFEIIVNAARGQGLPESHANALAKVAAPLVFKSEAYDDMK